MDPLADTITEIAWDDAIDFCINHETVLDPAKTDWDSVAWTEVVAEYELTPEQAERLWPVYQSALVKETARLMHDPATN
jgi:hypothetical protein